MRKVLLPTWWDISIHRISIVGYAWNIFFELIPENATTLSDVYCEQLQKLSGALQEKRPVMINRRKVVFQHYNARPSPPSDELKSI